jgi:hypothetical protein
MNKEFIDLALQIIAKNGNDLLKNSRLMKGLLLDHAHGEYKNEINLFVKILEMGLYNRIINSNNLEITKTSLIKQLREELFIMDNIAETMVLLLIGVLRDKRYLSQINKKPPEPEPPLPKNLENNLTKNKAIELCRANGFNVIGRITFASKNKTQHLYWSNPNIEFLEHNWWLLLNDYIHHQLHIFYIPANSIRRNQIKVRADIPDKIDLDIKYEDDLFEDNRSGIQFSRWFINTLSYE